MEFFTYETFLKFWAENPNIWLKNIYAEKPVIAKINVLNGKYVYAGHYKIKFNDGSIYMSTDLMFWKPFLNNNNE